MCIVLYCMIGANGGAKEARIPNPFRIQIAIPKPCKYFVRVDVYRNDYIRKIKDEASTQCNLVGLDVPSECFQVLETNVDEHDNDDEIQGNDNDDDDDNEQHEQQQQELEGIQEGYKEKKKKKKRVTDKVIKDTLTIEEIGLFHKSIQLKIKEGPCIDLLPNIYM